MCAHGCVCAHTLSGSVVSESVQSHGLSGSFVHGIFQARTLEWVAISYPGTEPASLVSPALAGGFFITAPLEGPSYFY